MVPVPCVSMAPVRPPAYQRALTKRDPALHSDALTLVTRLPLRALRRLAVQQAQHRCPPPCDDGNERGATPDRPLPRGDRTRRRAPRPGADDG